MHVCVLKRLEFLRMIGFDFEKAKLAAVDGNDGIELETPTGRVAARGCGLREFAQDNQVFGPGVKREIHAKQDDNQKEPGGPHG